MLRSVAVTRIQDGLGFASRQSDKIILRLQEAQRELERGKTLPKFLLQENSVLTLLEDIDVAPYPIGFLRIYDDNLPYYTDTVGNPTYIPVVRVWSDAINAFWLGGERSAPKALVLRKSSVSFINNADRDYAIVWSYYKSATSLTTDVENEWLANAPEWLIGEAGWRMAMDVRDKDAITLFDTMRKTGRAATFSEIVASEESAGPLIMGANL